MNYRKLYRAISNPRKFLDHERQSFLKIALKNEGLTPIHETRDNDVFIVGYPKSGNTWMQSIMSCIQYGIDPELLTFDLAYSLVPDVHAKQYYQRFSENVIFKSHDLPHERHKKVIYLVRDGRDVMISYQNHHMLNGNNYSLEDIILEEKGLFPCRWDIHVKNWIENPYNAKILFLRYEDLLFEGYDTLSELCKFIGIDRNEKFLKKIVDSLNVDNMRKKVKLEGGIGKFDIEKGIKFFREGVHGGYKNHENKKIFDWFSEKYMEEINHFGYEIS